MKQMLEAYEDFRSDGKLPATYEVVYGHAWCPEQFRQSTSDTVNVNFKR
jgi:malonyl-CoA O-methyltransferase